MNEPIDAAIDALLDAIERSNAQRVDYEPAVPRDTIREVLGAVAWLYGARNGSAASVYAADALQRAVKKATW
jgi:hypothetical protein